uniref:Uncharacterized protein n=1 Tax=Sphaerodactylus townsendi TaxID=933632 RepID=A0ACB8FED7_9SAUR
MEIKNSSEPPPDEFSLGHRFCLAKGKENFIHPPDAVKLVAKSYISGHSRIGMSFELGISFKSRKAFKTFLYTYGTDLYLLCIGTVSAEQCFYSREFTQKAIVQTSNVQ